MARDPKVLLAITRAAASDPNWKISRDFTADYEAAFSNPYHSTTQWPHKVTQTDRIGWSCSSCGDGQIGIFTDPHHTGMCPTCRRQALIDQAVNSQLYPARVKHFQNLRHKPEECLACMFAVDDILKEFRRLETENA